jgi:hypothetical protein
MTTLLNIRIVNRKGWLDGKVFYICKCVNMYDDHFKFFNLSFKDASLISENDSVETN